MDKRLLVLSLGVLLAAGVCACATGPKPPSDEEQIKAQLELLKAGVLGKDIDKVGTVVSKDFNDSRLGDRKSALEMVKQGMDMGVVDDGYIHLEQVKVAVKEGTATAGPIDVGNPGGSATITFTLKKEDGVWRISGGESAGF